MPLTKSSFEEMPPALAGAVKTAPDVAVVSTGSTNGACAALAGAAIALPTLAKNSPAIRFETEPSIRWPTPPTMPPTTASAS